MSYTLTHHAYCGMSSVPQTFVEEDWAEARAAAARHLSRARRSGFPTVTLEKGTRWEILEPEDAMMVPDSCGVLALRHQEEPDRDDPVDFDDWFEEDRR